MTNPPPTGQSPAEPAAHESAADPHDTPIDTPKEIANGTAVAEDHPDADPSDTTLEDTEHRGEPSRLTRTLAFLVLPIVVLAVAGGAGYAKYLQARHQSVNTARIESVAAARDITTAMLSYTPDNASATLGAAREKMTGPLLDSYTSLIDDVVIPGAKQKQISAAATVAAAVPLTVTDTHAVVLVFVDQSITQGKDAPSGTASSVRVTLDKVDSQWRASGFDPV